MKEKKVKELSQVTKTEERQDNGYLESKAHKLPTPRVEAKKGSTPSIEEKQTKE